jgi:hypothetical protein
MSPHERGLLGRYLVEDVAQNKHDVWLQRRGSGL